MKFVGKCVTITLNVYQSVKNYGILCVCLSVCSVCRFSSFLLHCMWLLTRYFQVSKSLTCECRLVSSCRWADLHVCAWVLVRKSSPKADWLHHLSLLCPVISLCNSNKCHTMGKGLALTNYSRHSQFALSPDALDEPSVALFCYLGQWDELKHHARFIAVHLFFCVVVTSNITLSPTQKIYLLKPVKTELLWAGCQLR